MLLSHFIGYIYNQKDSLTVKVKLYRKVLMIKWWLVKGGPGNYRD